MADESPAAESRGNAPPDVEAGSGSNQAAGPEANPVFWGAPGASSPGPEAPKLPRVVDASVLGAPLTEGMKGPGEFADEPKRWDPAEEEAASAEQDESAAQQGESTERGATAGERNESASQRGAPASGPRESTKARGRSASAATQAPVTAGLPPAGRVGPKARPQSVDDRLAAQRAAGKALGDALKAAHKKGDRDVRSNPATLDPVVAELMRLGDAGRDEWGKPVVPTPRVTAQQQESAVPGPKQGAQWQKPAAPNPKVVAELKERGQGGMTGQEAAEAAETAAKRSRALAAARRGEVMSQSTPSRLNALVAKIADARAAKAAQRAGAGEGDPQTGPETETTARGLRRLPGLRGRGSSRGAEHEQGKSREK